MITFIISKHSVIQLNFALVFFYFSTVPGFCSSNLVSALTQPNGSRTRSNRLFSFQVVLFVH